MPPRRSINLVAVVAAAAIVGSVAMLVHRGDVIPGFEGTANAAASAPADISAAPRPPAAPAPQPAKVAAAPTPAPDTADAVPQSREAIRLSFAPIVKRVAPAVVNVYATSRVKVRSPFEGDPFFERFFGGGGPFDAPRERERSSLGSGVIVDASGLIVTNNHVVGDATDVKVALNDGREFPAKILLKDERTDLAILKIDDGGTPLPVLPIGDSDALEVGDLVLAVGDPFGVGQTVTSGIVSALARTNLGINDFGFFIQTDAAINPGNSGGALVDMDGDLVGINSAIYSRSGGSIGIGFAIPSDMVRTVVAQAVAGSKSVARPWIGIASQDVTPEIASSLGLASPHGALVTRVDKDSPGEKAGIKVGDLILKAGDRDIGDSGALDYRLAVAGIGKDIPLTVWRDGASKVIDVTTAAEPELSKSDLTQISGRGPLSGAVVADLTAALADRMNIRGTTSGAVIVDVKPGSPAEQVGFEKGDVVLGAQGRTVTTGKQLADIVGKDSRYWRITFSRDGQISNVILGG
jgi:Do/DeqQ family serine protease